MKRKLKCHFFYLHKLFFHKVFEMKKIYQCYIKKQHEKVYVYIIPV